MPSSHCKHTLVLMCSQPPYNSSRAWSNLRQCVSTFPPLVPSAHLIGHSDRIKAATGNKVGSKTIRIWRRGRSYRSEFRSALEKSHWQPLQAASRPDSAWDLEYTSKNADLSSQEAEFVVMGPSCAVLELLERDLAVFSRVPHVTAMRCWKKS